MSPYHTPKVGPDGLCEFCGRPRASHIAPDYYCHRSERIATFYRCPADACLGHYGPQADQIANDW